MTNKMCSWQSLSSILSNKTVVVSLSLIISTCLSYSVPFPLDFPVVSRICKIKLNVV